MNAPVEYLTTKELAAVLKVSTWTIRNWAHQGVIPCVKQRNVYRFKLTDVEAALAPSTDPWAQPARARRRVA